MKINSKKNRIQSVDIYFAGEPTGGLTKRAQFEFNYHSNASTPVASSMPLDTVAYQRNALFPIFEMNIPEGYIRQRIFERLQKHIKVDEMLFLALQGASGVGCLSYRCPEIEHEVQAPEELSSLLAWDGDEELFETLVDKFLLQTSISGVQPKVLVPETFIREKDALVLPSLIVKSSDDQYPQCALNEFICMSLAKACDIVTPEFWLSENHALFIMRRFDLQPNGDCRAMEDMAVLQGKTSNAKYDASYESIAKAIDLYSSAPTLDKEIFFRMIVHSCMMGNGDGHLKNYAMLYDHVDNMRLSPLYDVVNTQVYVNNDTLALSLGKRKDFPDRRRIIDFARALGVKKPDDIIDSFAETIMQELSNLESFTDEMDSDIAGLIKQNIHTLTTLSPIKKRAARKHTKHP